MKLVVISHKPCWSSSASASGYVTDGGFPIQMATLSELFGKTTLTVPVNREAAPSGTMPLTGTNLQIQPLTMPRGKGIRRKLLLVPWVLWNVPKIVKTIHSSDAVHTPIPGDVGTIGMLIAFLMRKPLFVRHCGNWFVQRTTAERFWRWFMERYAGGRNVFMATGGAEDPPSHRNRHISWIFSTSLTQQEILDRALHKNHEIIEPIRLITVGRQERNKNTNLVVEALSIICSHGYTVTLDVVGDGGELENLRSLADRLDVREYIRFHGKVDHSTVIELLTKAHIFCFPTESEGFPKAVVEAMACGCPVITNPVSVLPQLVNDCGILLSHVSAQDIAGSVIRMWQNESEYFRMAETALIKARDYSLEAWRDAIKAKLEAQWKN